MRIVFTLLTAFFFQATIAQITISGKLTDTRQKPISGGSISIKDSYDGTTTDSSGNFVLTTSEKGLHTLTASAVGYSSYEKTITIEKNIQLNISIKELITELKAVVLSAGSFEASDQKKATILSSIDIVTTASANADITSAIKTLPGAQQVEDEEGLFVRGGTANESKTFIDGTLVNNFYYSSEPGLAQRGRFNPFIFKGTVFSSGGYSALYGQALSSVLILESIDLPERSSGQISLSYLGIGGGLQHLSKNKKSSFGFSYNYTDLKYAFKLIKQRPDYFTIPVLHNADINFRIKTKGGMIKYYGMLGITNAGFRYADIDSAGMKNAFALNNLNLYHNLSWKENLGKGYKLMSGFSFSTNKDDIEGSFLNAGNEKVQVSDPLYLNKNFSLLSKGKYYNAKAVLEKRLKGLTAVRVGSEINYANDERKFTAHDGNIGKDTIAETIISAFGETDIYLTNNLAAKIGVRAEHSQLLNDWNAAPRFSLSYKLPQKGQLSFAYGIFYQAPDKKYLPASNSISFSQATQYILQYQKVSASRTFRSEIFYKNYNSLYKTNVRGRPGITGNEGYGYAKGLEFFWRDKKTIKNLDYWISYSYLDTKRDHLNYPGSIEPTFVAKHTTSLVVKKFVSKLKSMVNASYTYATGRPYYNIRYDELENKYKTYDQGRTKDFNSLSFSVNYLPNISKKGASKFSVFVFSVTNVMGSSNIYGYNYSYNGKNKQPILPPSKRFFFLGCFLSFGIDRTQDAINNNL